MTAFFLKKKMDEQPGKWDGSLATAMYEIAFRNVFDLRDQLAGCVGFLPYFWAVLMKQCIPQIILILFINLAQSTNDNGDALFGNYGGYLSWPFQVLGYLVVVFAGFLFLFGLAVPHAYDGLTLIDEKTIVDDSIGEHSENKEDDNDGMEVSETRPGKSDVEDEVGMSEEEVA